MFYFTSSRVIVSTSVAHRPDLNLEKHNLPTNPICEVGVCLRADIGGWEATSEYRKANPTQSEDWGLSCEVDIGGKPGSGFLRKKKPRTVQKDF